MVDGGVGQYWSRGMSKRPLVHVAVSKVRLGRARAGCLSTLSASRGLLDRAGAAGLASGPRFRRAPDHQSRGAYSTVLRRRGLRPSRAEACDETPAVAAFSNISVLPGTACVRIIRTHTLPLTTAR